jgi:serine/threonine protein kinase
MQGVVNSVWVYTDSVAIKRILCENLVNSDEAKRKYEDSKMEINVMSNLSYHINLVKLVQSEIIAHSQEKVSIFIAMEYLKGISLFESFNSNAVTEWAGCRRVEILICIHSALLHIHSHGFVHMDICPNNIMIELDTGRVVIIDFGFSKFSDVNQRETVANLHQSSKRGGLGTLGYVAPENGTSPTWLVYVYIFSFLFTISCSASCFDIF